jgi:hypothetical protein
MFLTQKMYKHGKYGPQDNIRHHAGKPMPGVATPTILKPKG